MAKPISTQANTKTEMSNALSTKHVLLAKALENEKKQSRYESSLTCLIEP